MGARLAWSGPPFAVVKTCARCGAPVWVGHLHDGQTVTLDVRIARPPLHRAFVVVVSHGKPLIRLWDRSCDSLRPRWRRHECYRS
jgi:hypothetical protein